MYVMLVMWKHFRHAAKGVCVLVVSRRMLVAGSWNKMFGISTFYGVRYGKIQERACLQRRKMSYSTSNCYHDIRHESDVQSIIMKKSCH